MNAQDIDARRRPDTLVVLAGRAAFPPAEEAGLDQVRGVEQVDLGSDRREEVLQRGLAAWSRWDTSGVRNNCCAGTGAGQVDASASLIGSHIPSAGESAYRLTRAFM